MLATTAGQRPALRGKTVVEELEREYAPIKAKVHDLREYL
jgi:hypothetical protein